MKSYYLLFIGYCVLSIADALTTQVGLSMGYVEGNIFIEFLIQHSVIWVYLVQVIAIVLIYIMIVIAKKRSEKEMIVVLSTISIFKFIVVVNNLAKVV